MSEIEIPALEEITSTNPMQREMNKGLMIRFINNNLLSGGANLDVRSSIVYYDEDKDFVYASDGPLAKWELELLYNYNQGTFRYWSKGIV